jgi:4-hydroxythreonine-4-phosphate dehydrogenase
MRPLRVCITTGDTTGIGLEVTVKALKKLGPKPNVQFLLWRSAQAPTKFLKQIDGTFKRITVKTWPEAVKVAPDSHKFIVDIGSNHSPADWVEQSAQAGAFGHIDALATAPLSKQTIIDAGYKDLGHTEILKRVTKSHDLFMTFIGKDFSVLLITGHHPLAEVPGRLRPELVESALRAAHEVLPWLPKKTSRLPMALVGLNPHGGENKLIGSEESRIFLPVLEKLKKEKFLIEGPLVPDVAFQKQYHGRYSIYVSPYHDQGLIPFKMTHGFSGVHVTMGLPFVRTSVDHGTAKDIFGKNKADPESMIEAVKWAINLSRKKLEPKNGKDPS